VLKQFLYFWLRKKLWCQSGNIPAIGFLLILSLMSNSLSIKVAQGSEPSAVQPSHPLHPTSTSKYLPADGTYLYGEDPQPDQIGKAYMVIEVQQGKAIGALYMPLSSFDCFQGTFQPDQLVLAIQDSYSQETSPYIIPLVNPSIVATTGRLLSSVKMALQGFYPLKTLSENDQRILKSCKANT
jgi:hypothetical protein